MGQRTDEIEEHIEDTREDLKSNLQELENRVKSATDWRHYFEKHTGAMLAVAFGGGVLLSALLGTRTSSSTGVSEPADGARFPTAGPKHEALKNWDTITRALVGAAAMRFKGALGQVVPGFTERLAQIEGDRPRDPLH